MSTLKIYSVWGKGCDDCPPNTLIEGEVPPTYGNGVVQDDCDKLFFKFHANSWEEASEIFIKSLK